MSTEHAAIDGTGFSRRGVFALAAGATVSVVVATIPGVPALARAVPGPDDVGLAPSEYPRLFGTAELALGGPLRYLPKAQALVDALADPAPGGHDLDRWTRLLGELSGAAPMTQLEEVNRFVNGVRYLSDRRHWGVDDRWASPAEFFAEGGDCEDYALVKFVSLHRLGFNVGRLRMVLARDERKSIDHGFLAVYLGGEALVLDNQIKTVTPHEAISHYRPLCSFNDQRLWLHRS